MSSTTLMMEMTVPVSRPHRESQVTYMKLSEVSGVDHTTIWKNIVLLRRMLRGEVP